MPLPDHYATLGVAPTALPDEIKRRYRSLARQYHPDINPSPDAAQKIKVINEAYHVLHDSDRRATYDAERMLNERAAQNTPPRPANGSTSPNSNSSRKPDQTTAAQAPKRPQFDFNGFGRVTTGQSSTARPTVARPVKQTISKEEVKRKTDGLIAEAQLAYVNRRYREAEDLCQEILTLDRRNAIAHEVIADILMKRGQKAAAELHYSYSVQFNPQNKSVQAKLDRLMGNRAAPTGDAGPTMARPTPTSPRDALANFPHTEALITSVSVLLIFGFFGILLLLWNHPGEAIFSGWLTAFSVQLIFALGINGVIGGILLAFYGGLRPATEELFTHENLRGDQRTPTSIGAILVAFAFVWFFASALIYVGVAFARNRLSTSVLRVYGTSLVLSCLFSIVSQTSTHPDSTLQIIALSGNILFPTLVFGWLIGDFVRLRGR